MNNKQWYEVFAWNKTEGSRTLKCFKTLEEAKIYKTQIGNENEYGLVIGTIHIDKWENTDSPRIIDKIE